VEGTAHGAAMTCSKLTAYFVGRAAEGHACTLHGQKSGRQPALAPIVCAIANRCSPINLVACKPP